MSAALAVVLLALAGSDEARAPATVDPSEAAPEAARAPLPPPDETRARHAPRIARPDIPSVPVAALQCATGCAVLAGALPLSLVCTVATCAGAPFLIGYFQTWVGDRLGAARAPAIGPILATYIGVGASLSGGVLAVVAGTLAGVPASTAQALGAGTATVLLALTLGAGPVVYALSASPKHALDDGTDPPDFFDARVPLVVRNQRR